MPDLPFADMPEDLPWTRATTAPVEDTDARMARAARPRLASAPPPAPSEHHEPCPRCNGTGRWHSYSGFSSGECFACKGAGYIVRKTSPEVRERAREQRAERAARSAADNLAAFGVRHSEVLAWIGDKAPEFEFAASMRDAIERWGDLTPGQMDAIYRCMARDAERQDARRTWAAKHADVIQWVTERTNSRFAQSLADSLDHYGTLTEGQVAAVRRIIADDRVADANTPRELQAPALRLPRLHNTMQHLTHLRGGPVTLARQNQSSLVWIKHRTQDKPIGKLEDGGRLTLWTRPGVDMGEVRSILDQFEADPLAAAKAFGKASGNCCVCGRDLTDPVSIDMGIGPICAEKFAF